MFLSHEIIDKYYPNLMNQLLAHEHSAALIESD